jgi:methionyl-tRNA synthetase
VPRHLVTSALSRVGGVGHLDSLAGSLLPADVYCRFLRARGEEVLFVCASGEHGARAERLHEAEVGLAARLGLSFDAFGRSASPLNAQQTQYFARRLEQEGYVEVREGGTLFFLQSRLAAELRAHLRRLDDGVEGRSITRDLGWGIPVDRTGFEGIVYHWGFDTPIAYIGATREWAEARGEPSAWRRWWCASEDVRYVQFMTSREVALHAVCFPCALIGAREGWKLADAVKAFHSFTRGGELCSSRPGTLVGAVTELPADCWRYWLLASAPETGEERFSWESLAAAVDADLVEVFAGFVAGVFDFALSRFGGAVPAGGTFGSEEEELAVRLEAGIATLAARISALEFRRAVAELRSAWILAVEYLERKQSRGSFERDRENAAGTARVCLNLLSLLARLSAPLMPFTAERLLDALGVPIDQRGWPARFEPAALAAGHPVGAPPPLFRPEPRLFAGCEEGPLQCVRPTTERGGR